MKNIIDTLTELTNLNAIASNEEAVIHYLKNHLKVDYKQDRLGSVIANKGQGKNVLITAPMDELGMIVSQVKPNGLIAFQNVGSMQSKNALNQLFTITTKVRTFVATLVGKPLSLQTKEELLSVDDFKHLYLDAGFNSSKEVFESGIQIGDMITRYRPLLVMNKDQVISKALESRAPVSVLKSLINDIDTKDVTLHAAFTVQHKMGMKGAKTTSFIAEPEIAISLDTIETTNYNQNDGIKLGHGPVITFYDKGLIAHPKLRNFIIGVCKTKDIAYQEAYQMDVLSEGHYLQLAKLGAASISIGIPIKNKNSHNQMIDLNDLAMTKKLLEMIIVQLNSDIIDDILYGSN